MSVYGKAGERLVHILDGVWATEEDMTTWFKETAHVDLDRTGRAKMLVQKLVDSALSPDMNSASVTNVDRIGTLVASRERLGDFNLYTQLRLNLQEGCPAFNLEKMTEDFKVIQDKYPQEGDSPLAKKAKYKIVTTEEEKAFNEALALLKNIKIVSEMHYGTNSYRITPFNKTPALSDLNNLSSMSPLAMVPYLRGAELYMFDSSVVNASINLRQTEDGIVADGLRWPIRSESGGDIVNKAIASRYLLSVLIDEPSIKHIVPRYESLLILKDGPSEVLDSLIEKKMVTPYAKP